MFEGEPQENLRRDLRRLADDVADMRQALLAGRRESAERMAHSAKEQFDRAREQASEKVHEVDAYVKENPWLAAGVAAAAGIVLGALLGRSKRR